MDGFKLHKDLHQEKNPHGIEEELKRNGGFQGHEWYLQGIIWTP